VVDSNPGKSPCAFFGRKAREVAGDGAPHEGPYTVADALSTYLKA
jgi:hypothetical protein